MSGRAHERPLSPDEMLRLILTSRVYDVAQETPLDPAPRLSSRLGNSVLLKREDLQPIFTMMPVLCWQQRGFI